MIWLASAGNNFVDMAGLGIFAGVFYPRPGVVVNNGVPGYELDRRSTQRLCDQLVGCPITLEHHGIATISKYLSKNPDGTEVIRALNNAANVTGKHNARPIGIISNAYENARGEFVCIFNINTTAFSSLCALINSHVLRGLSLSHFHDETLPLEVSLCQRPARPECFITAGPFTLPSVALMYKALDQSADIHSILHHGSDRRPHRTHASGHGTQ